MINDLNISGGPIILIMRSSKFIIDGRAMIVFKTFYNFS